MKKLSFSQHSFNQARQHGALPPGTSSGSAHITPAQATAQANKVLVMVLLGLLSAVSGIFFA